MLKYHGIIYFFFLSLFACERNQKVDLTGSLEVKSPFYFDLYEMESGSKVIADTLYSDTFKIKLDKLPKGIYQLVFSWDRDIMKPQEIERFTRQPELGTPKYYMSTTFWLDTKESNNYTLLLDSTYQQSELEELLLAKNGSESIKIAVVSDGANNKLYNRYLALVDRYRAKNRHQKDSLQQVVAHYNDLKLFEDSERLNALLAKDWLPNVKTALLREEINFMKDNIDSEVIPLIYHIQVNTKEDFEQYREVYNLFPLSVKQNFTVWNKSN
ncbi:MULTISPECIES: hypothetical protein [Sphingobacterium]|uniref:hypothetical protein n=1 Tax=Sphingobacterium TaxID=28453 RepID=UPI00257CCB03|nr:MULTISPECIES: hypothetical protein [Sphingobacterium]